MEFSKMVQLNFQGQQLEKTGDIDGAVKCYETNIANKFEGNAPYDRLAIIYRKKKQIDQEIRVLKQAIFVFEEIVNPLRADRVPKLNKFKKRLDKALTLI